MEKCIAFITGDPQPRFTGSKSRSNQGLVLVAEGELFPSELEHQGRPCATGRSVN